MKSQNFIDTLFLEEDGPFLISSARQIIEAYLDTEELSIPHKVSSDRRFSNKMGCFVTLKNNNYEKSLRGCIGFPEPVHELSRAFPEAAISAATRDPRFPRVKKSEISNLLLEISLLTEPVQIKVSSQRDIPNEIEVGRDGLIMKWAYGSGLLLPQVAAEYGWDEVDFLCNLSLKAGAPPDQWLVPGTLIYRFRAQIFQENSPNGTVSVNKD